MENLGFIALLCFLIFIALGLTQYTSTKNNKKNDDFYGEY